MRNLSMFFILYSPQNEFKANYIYKTINVNIYLMYMQVCNILGLVMAPSCILKKQE